MNHVGGTISISPFSRWVNLSTPRNIVGNSGFGQVLASFQAKASEASAVHKNGLTAGDYLAHPVISKSAIFSDVSRKSFQMITADRPSERSSPSKPTHISEGDAIERSIQNAAEKYNLPPALIKAVIKAESNFDANAVSKAGAQGLMQLMPATAREIGVKDSFDIDQNIDGGSFYLRKMLDKFGGNTKMALAAYNAGPGAVEKFKGNVPYPETRNYIKRVMRFSAKFA